ncbi:hypothetical protein [Plasticicumulans sp.]|uniref:hypothetical protein n=1 Tax=Plasticicumulans sp. TaxID=2307179 RepID=UPI002B581733|nr:hypothetical protein [Plasticicumulans sp.]MBS0602882.1 hypothetical protein [Pseudomonadota bacterium]HMV40708.1 hypothetical protein [Plasticicumulans sp.]HMW29858.1 hypothetical protein [Plasticicumulans sp.]HMW41187.1 hypothetical protein [Plasticicumulans sp.]HMX54765.1 hypothetical protein [Plasticicumulans sp.]
MQRLIHRQRLRRIQDQQQQHALRRGRGQVWELAQMLDNADGKRDSDRPAAEPVRQPH